MIQADCCCSFSESLKPHRRAKVQPVASRQVTNGRRQNEEENWVKPKITEGKQKGFWWTFESFLKGAIQTLLDMLSWAHWWPMVTNGDQMWPVCCVFHPLLPFEVVDENKDFTIAESCPQARPCRCAEAAKGKWKTQDSRHCMTLYDIVARGCECTWYMWHTILWASPGTSILYDHYI
jgi:hypothetical protein